MPSTGYVVLDFILWLIVLYILYQIAMSVIRGR